MIIRTFLYSLLAIIGEMAPYILLGFLIAGVLHEFVSPATLSRQLSGHGWGPVLKAALFGVPLPLCSCGVLPTAIGLRRQGASRGATTSFLIATPQTGVDSIAATYSLLGLPMAIIRPIAALVGGVFGGMWVDMADRRSSNPSDSKQEPNGEECKSGQACSCNATDVLEPKRGFWHKCLGVLQYGLVEMVASVGKWLTLGLLIAVLITLLVPDTWVLALASRPWAAMIVALAIAVPMYVCATGSIPIALSLIAKGLTPGVAFVFLMAGPAVNFASMIVLGKNLGRRTTIIYISSVIITAVLFGLGIDYLLPRSWFAPSLELGDACCEPHSLGWFSIFCTIVFVGTLINAYFYTHRKHTKSSAMAKVYKIKGMECNHCRMTVEKAIASVEGVTKVVVDLSSATASVEGTADESAIRASVERSGFELE